MCHRTLDEYYDGEMERMDTEREKEADRESEGERKEAYLTSCYETIIFDSESLRFFACERNVCTFFLPVTFGTLLLINERHSIIAAFIRRTQKTERRNQNKT